MSFKASPFHRTLAPGSCLVSAEQMWLLTCNLVASQEGISLHHEPVSAMQLRPNPASPARAPWCCMGSCCCRTRNQEQGQAVHQHMGDVSPRTCSYFALSGGSHWPQTISGTEVRPAAEPAFLCVSSPAFRSPVACFRQFGCLHPGAGIPGSLMANKQAGNVDLSEL